MKTLSEQMRDLLVTNPYVTLPDAMRALHKDPQNNKNAKIAYWQARALLIEELTGQTIGDLIKNEGPSAPAPAPEEKIDDKAPKIIVPKEVTVDFF